MRDHIRIRRFLNLPGHHSVAYIFAVVSDTETCTDTDCKHHWCSDTTLQIGDCNRSVSLEFELYDADARRNSLHKIEVLIDSLTRFRDALRAEADVAAARERRQFIDDAASPRIR